MELFSENSHNPLEKTALWPLPNVAPSDTYDDKNIFKRIFVENWDNFAAMHPRYNTEYYHEIIDKMLACGDPDKMGYVQYRCFHCGETRRISFSCKSSFCLSCSKVYTDRWVEFIGRRLFPGVVYRHVTLTVPEFLRVWFYRDPSLTSKLMPIGHACLTELCSEIKKTQLDIGTVIILQTNGRSGNYNPHLHTLMTAGGIDPNGTWRSIGYFPYEFIHKKWQYHLLEMLRNEVNTPIINTHIDHGYKQYPNGFVAHVQDGEVPAGGKGLAQYLAKYLVSPPISVRRIEHYDGQNVAYWYKDHKTNAIQHTNVPVIQFIGRMVQHILPKGTHRIRYYGLHSNRRYEEARNQIATLRPTDIPDDPLGFRVIARKPFAQLYFETFQKEPLICQRCGSKMELELIEHPQYGTIRNYFDDIIERLCDAPEDSTPARPMDIPSGPMERTQRVVQLPLPHL